MTAPLNTDNADLRNQKLVNWIYESIFESAFRASQEDSVSLSLVIFTISNKLIFEQDAVRAMVVSDLKEMVQDKKEIS